MTGDLNNGQGLSVNTALSDMSVIPEVEPPPVSSEKAETEVPVENDGGKPAETPPGITDISDTKEQLSVIPEAENLSSTDVSENPAVLSDNSSGIKGDPPSVEDYGDWDSECWGV